MLRCLVTIIAARMSRASVCLSSWETHDDVTFVRTFRGGDLDAGNAWALQVDERKLKGHVDELLRSSVEETLNAEPDAICRARRYEHSPERVDRRAGSYERKLETKAGEVTLKVPKLRSLPFEISTAGNRRCLVEMYLAGVLVRRVDDISEALWGPRVSSGTGSTTSIARSMCGATVRSPASFLTCTWVG